VVPPAPAEAAPGPGKAGNPKVRTKPLIPALVEALKDADESVSVNASRALAGLGLEAVPPLVKVVRDRDNPRRLAAIDVLARMGGDGRGEQACAALPELARALQDNDPAVRRSASRAIYEIVRSVRPSQEPKRKAP